MTGKVARISFFLVALAALWVSTPLAAQPLNGNWTGTFNSNHSDVKPFFISIIVTSDSKGRVIGNSTLEAQCMKNANLNISISGAAVVFAGNDGHGDNITIRGTLDPTGAIINSTYIMNGSQGGGCETDDGTGSLQKR